MVQIISFLPPFTKFSVPFLSNHATWRLCRFIISWSPTRLFVQAHVRVDNKNMSKLHQSEDVFIENVSRLYGKMWHHAQQDRVCQFIQIEIMAWYWMHLKTNYKSLFLSYKKSQMKTINVYVFVQYLWIWHVFLCLWKVLYQVTD